MATIFTIGYGNRKLNDFISLLKRYDIRTVVDVRRFPTSKFPDYKKENLQAELLRSGIKYVFMGEELGGFRRKGYQKYMETEEYKEGIEKLIEFAKEDNVAIMCVERTPKACHRRYITQTLEGKGIDIKHIK